MATPLCKRVDALLWKSLRVSQWYGQGGLWKVSTRATLCGRPLASWSSNMQQQAVGVSEASCPRDQEAPVSQVETALEHEDFFKLKELVTLRDLFHARVHLGHNTGLRHASMSPYIFGERQGVDIIDLEQTLPLLLHALNVCAHISYRGGMALFISRNMQMLPWVERMAKDVGEYSHCRAWKRGIFTNASSIFGTLPIYPEMCIFLSTQDTVFEMHRGIVESSKLLIPSIGIVDTNCDSSNITYPIPGNDDSPASVHLYLRLFKEAILRAKAKRKEDGLDGSDVDQS